MPLPGGSGQVYTTRGWGETTGWSAHPLPQGSAHGLTPPHQGPDPPPPHHLLVLLIPDSAPSRPSAWASAACLAPCPSSRVFFGSQLHRQLLRRCFFTSSWPLLLRRWSPLTISCVSWVFDISWWFHKWMPLLPDSVPTEKSYPSVQRSFYALAHCASGVLSLSVVSDSLWLHGL